jgi:gluconate kinase
VAFDHETAGEKTHAEAALMTEITLAEALRRKKHVLVDSSLRDWRWFKKYFAWVRREYPTRRIAIIHVEAEQELVLQRAERRAKTTGRMVPAAMLQTALVEVPKSVEQLAPLTDYTATVHNEKGRMSLVRGDACWADFRSRWELCGAMRNEHQAESLTNTIIFPPNFTAPKYEPDLGDCPVAWPSIQPAGEPSATPDSV